MKYSKLSLVLILSVWPIVTLGMEKQSMLQEEQKSELIQELGDRTSVQLKECTQLLERLNFSDKTAGIKSYAVELDKKTQKYYSSLIYYGSIAKALDLINQPKSAINVDNKGEFTERANKGVRKCLDAIEQYLKATKKAPETAQTTDAVQTREKLSLLLLYLQNISADKGFPLNVANIERINRNIQELLVLELAYAQRLSRELLSKFTCYQAIQMHLIKNTQDCLLRNSDHKIKPDVVCFDNLFEVSAEINQQLIDAYKKFQEKIEKNLEQFKPSDKQPQDQSK